MPLSHSFNTGDGILRVTVTRRLDVADMAEFVSHVQKAQVHSVGVDTIWDLDNFDFTEAHEGSLDPLMAIYRADGALPRARFVLVAGSDLAFGMCRMAQMTHEAQGLVPTGQVHIARSEQEATDWLTASAPVAAP